LERTGRASPQTSGQRGVVEPNVKEGKGGLARPVIITFFWISNTSMALKTRAELVGLAFSTPEEFETLSQPRIFLWAVRCHLHLIVGRANGPALRA
jgi:[protein-PII] uridylyltransferase